MYNNYCPQQVVQGSLFGLPIDYPRCWDGGMIASAAILAVIGFLTIAFLAFAGRKTWRGMPSSLQSAVLIYVIGIAIGAWSGFFAAHPVRFETLFWGAIVMSAFALLFQRMRSELQLAFQIVGMLLTILFATSLLRNLPPLDQLARLL